jgi:hypothetical protein
MKLFRLIPAVVLVAACASSTPQPPAQATTTPAQPDAKMSTTAVIDPVGAYEFSTVVDGQTVTGTMHVEGGPGNYKGRIVTSVFPEIPIVGANVESNVVILRGSMPDGELTMRLTMEGQNFKGNWMLGGGSGEITGKKLAK